MNLIEEKISREDYFSGRVFTVHKDEVRLPDGKISHREVVDHNGGVMVAALTAEKELVFVRQFRYPYAKVILELPAGKLERGEEPLSAALRELREETGMTAARSFSLGQFYPTPGYCSEVIHMFAAMDLIEGVPQPDDGEFVETVRIPLEDAVKMVLENEIADGKTQTAILKLKMLLDKKAI